MSAKSIFQSKTFWLNVVGFAFVYAHYLPSEYAALVLAVANILNRFLTSKPVTLL